MSRDDPKADRMRRLQALGRAANMAKRQQGLAFAKRWKAARQAERPRFPYAGHRHCGEWV